MVNLNHLMGHIMYQIFKIFISIPLKKHESLTGNPTIRTFVNKIENGIRFKILIRYYRILSTPETMKLLGSTKNKIAKD